MSSTASTNRVHPLLWGTLWVLCLAVWTAALLTSKPAQVNRQLFPPELALILSKGLHISAYAFLAAFALWMTLRPYRWLLLASLFVHAALTEFLQRYVPCS
jgi:hypothetical protein